MSTKRIQDLENVEEVLPDNLIPVGESTKTKSMLISQLKTWLSNFFVNNTGDETIAGNKTFTGKGCFQSSIEMKSTDIDINNVTKASSNNIFIRDKNSVITGVIQRYYDATDSDSMSMTLIGKNGKSYTISITKPSYSDAYLTIPEPKITDNGKQAVTANWVRQVSALADLSNVSFDGIGRGYVYIGNLLIQFGRLSLKQGNNTVTFNKPFIEKPIIYANSESATEVTRVSANTPNLTTMKIYSSYNGNLLTDWLAIGKGA